MTYITYPLPNTVGRMNHKIKSTITGVLVALSFITASGLLGKEPITACAQSSVDNIAHAIPLDVTVASQDADEIDNQRLRRQLAMPYFSFSRGLPKQGL